MDCSIIVDSEAPLTLTCACRATGSGMHRLFVDRYIDAIFEAVSAIAILNCVCYGLRGNFLNRERGSRLMAMRHD